MGCGTITSTLAHTAPSDCRCSRRPATRPRSTHQGTSELRAMRRLARRVPTRPRRASAVYVAAHRRSSLQPSASSTTLRQPSRICRCRPSRRSPPAPAAFLDVHACRRAATLQPVATLAFLPASRVPCLHLRIVAPHHCHTPCAIFSTAPLSLLSTHPVRALSPRSSRWRPKRSQRLSVSGCFANVEASVCVGSFVPSRPFYPISHSLLFPPS